MRYHFSMKIKLLFLLLVALNSLAFAQVDREHWFAPMFDRVGNSSQYQSIYLSTSETVPFAIDIYHNNVIIKTVTVSKNNPVKYAIPNGERERIITTRQQDLFRPVKMGLYLKGEKPFYASLRFSILNHSEIQTSKGTAALGKEFRAVMAPVSVENPILNFMNSVMATEDSTRVIISSFDPGTVFSDGVARSEIDFILNKGESYLIDGAGDMSANFTGYIGAKIKADKPVIIANGNFNGQYSGDFINSSDILMDQGVPIDKLGQEFVLVKGNGSLISGMERAIIVATEDDTEIYLNDASSPAAVLNAGKFYLTDAAAYSDRGAGHFNMRIKTSKNAYVYQLLAGAASTSENATGGFNYIPPLNCYLPQKIDEIGRIDENEYSSNNEYYQATVPTKLNIITERGARVEVKQNGTSVALSAANGPFDVAGNPNWVTYSVPNIRGNVAIYSTNAVTAGISAGNNSVGYGGFFAGFSSIPFIVKLEGECIPRVKLGVIEGFKSYRWLLKTGNNYVDAPGINHLYYYQPTQAGIYAVEVQQGSCTQLRTPDFKFFNCTGFTNTDYEACSEVRITPQFSLSSQTVKTGSLKIDAAPKKGQVTIENGNEIIYTAAPNAAGTDVFSYSFCGTGNIPDCEKVQATVHIKQIVPRDAILYRCTDSDTAMYDLSQADVTGDPVTSSAYYLSQTAAETQNQAERITDFTHFNTANRDVYVRMQNDFGCVAFAKIELVAKQSGRVYPERYTKLHCDEDLDGVIDGIFNVNLSTVTPSVVENPGDYTIRYYSSEGQANAGLQDDLRSVYRFSAAGNTVWIRAEPKNGCPAVVKAITLQINEPLAITNTVSVTVCDDDLDGSRKVRLKDYQSAFTGDPNVSATYHRTRADAEQNANPIHDETVDILQTGTFYLRFSNAEACASVGVLEVTIKIPRTSALPEKVEICPNAVTRLDAGPGFTTYLWSDGSKTQSISATPGQYWVELTAEGCTYRQDITVSAAALPKIDAVEIQNGTVTILVSGGNPPYEYSLDGKQYQPSNVFYNVRSGDYTVYVRSKELCDPVTAGFSIVRILNVITPNDDGKNDVLDYSSLLTKQEPYLEVFDRYGAVVFKGSSANRFVWDGTTGGRKNATGNYWYVMQWTEPKTTIRTQHKGWILLKQRD